jgi:uncharacterized protein with von Willebrand factor type A (vWA) domain
MPDYYKDLLEVSKFPPDSLHDCVGVYANMRKILEDVVREKLGKDKYASLPDLNVALSNFCYETNMNKKREFSLHKLRKRANDFIHGNRPANADYFNGDIKTLCEAISLSTGEAVPEDFKNIYEKPKLQAEAQHAQNENIQQTSVQAIKKSTEKLTPQFTRFEKFGSIADEKTRQDIAKQTYNSALEIGLPVETKDKDADKFTDAINEILDKDEIYDVANNNPELAGKITADVLNFVSKTKKLMDRTENPFAQEIEAFNEFQNSSENDFEKEWESTKEMLTETYAKEQIDTDFYEKEFADSFDKESKNKNKPSFNSVKEHLSDKWQELLEKKQLDWELEIIDRERKKFIEELYKQIEDLKRLQDALAPFTNELGRLWDLSKGNWQKINFDLLKYYAELLAKDKSIQELAEMIGRMQQAEKEYEEELFTDVRLKTGWKVEAASKSDLIGVHESDDISNVLPSEFALLADPLTEVVFYKKFTEKKLQTFEYQGRTQEIIEENFENKRQKAKDGQKGPFIICVDTSGSMHGTPETVAKLLCFAILKIAIRENRKCYLISFSTGIKTLNLTDLKNSLDKIIQFLSMSFQGGTDATSAMRESLRMLETEDYKKADVVMVSDFVMPAFDEHMQQQISQAKEKKTKFHSLVIGTSQNNAVIKDFDNNWLYNINRKENVLTLVKNLYNL